MRLTSIIVCILPVVFGACVLKPKSDRVIQSETSIVTKNYKWDKRNLIVCFVDSKEQLSSYEKQNLFVENSNAQDFNLMPLFDKQKKEIQSAVESSFNNKNVGLNFTGWKTCADNEIPDVAVAFSYTPYKLDLSVSAIGDPSKKFQTRKINIVRLNLGYFSFLDDTLQEISKRHSPAAVQEKMIDEYKSYDLISSIVHEFGHISGLHHEHYRTDSYEVMKAADISYNSNASRNLIATNQQTKLLDSPEAKDFQFLGEYDPFSNMNYLRASNTHFLEIALNCLEKKYLNLTPQEFKLVCDMNQIKKLIQPDQTGNYLSEGDHAALKTLYAGSHAPTKMTLETQKLFSWVKKIKQIIEKSQLKFPYTLDDPEISISTEALFCPFNQGGQARVIRILTDKSATIHQAWYTQNKYQIPNFSYHGFEFDSVQKSTACENCVDLSTTYKGQKFKASVKFKIVGDRFVLRINDLATNLECYKGDLLMFNEILKARQKNQSQSSN